MNEKDIVERAKEALEWFDRSQYDPTDEWQVAEGVGAFFKASDTLVRDLIARVEYLQTFVDNLHALNRLRNEDDGIE